MRPFRGLASSYGNPLDQVTCFNCGVFGHSQISCTNPPYCYLCQEPGHPDPLFLDRPVVEELMMYGHGIEGLGFFHIEVADIPPPTPSLLAVVTVLGEGMASPEMIEAELNHLYRCQWHWQVTPTSVNECTVIFPDAVNHGYDIRTGCITLALNKLVVDISEPARDPKAVPVLDTTWILIGGLPDIARLERVIPACLGSSAW
ncbi:hypothetical protein D1007_11070 [Hordeum vulgare]|nr:hypothetical protein D1007_11070 [Hordeum vulgare]